MGPLHVGFIGLLPGSARLLVLAQLLLPGVVVALLLDEVARAGEHRLLDCGRCHFSHNLFFFLI